MGRRSKEIIYPHLNDCNGDVGRKWYVELSALNKLTGEMIRYRIHDGFRKYTTYEERKNHADTIIKEYTEKLDSGWRPFENQEFEYEDALAYYESITFKGKKTKSKSYIQPLFTDYLNWKKPYIALTTWEDQRSKFRKFYQYLEANSIHEKNIHFYNYEIIVHFLRELAKIYAQRTIDKYKQVLFAFFSFVKKEKKINIKNPLGDNIPRMGKIVDNAPAGIPSSIRIVLKKEIEKEDPQLWMSCCFIYYTAIRPCTELRLLKIKQINFDSMTITVFNDIAKNRRTETIDIPDDLHKLIMEEWKLHNYNGDLYLFGIDGLPGTEPLGRNTMRNRFNRIRDRLNLSKDIKYYSWKHSGAQELADAGASTYELQRHLRHRELSSTESYLKKRIGQRSNMIKHNFPSIG